MYLFLNIFKEYAHETGEHGFKVMRNMLSQAGKDPYVARRGWSSKNDQERRH